MPVFNPAEEVHVTHIFKAGEIVVYAYGEHSRTDRIIAKVYRNGNFILEGDKSRQQWKPVGGTNDYAKEAGSYRYSSPTVYAKTERRIKQWAEQEKQSQRSRRWREGMEYLREIRGPHVSEEQVSMLEAMVDTIKIERAEASRIAGLKCLETPAEWCSYTYSRCSCSACTEYKAHKPL